MSQIQIVRGKGTNTGQVAPAVEGRQGAQEAATADVLLPTEEVLRVDLWGH